MKVTWNSLHLSCDDHQIVADALRQRLAALSYTLFDPFSAAPGKAYDRALRLFVSPARSGWVRLVGTATPDAPLAELLLPDLSTTGTALALALAADGTAQVQAAVDGAAVPAQDALRPHLRPGCTHANLSAALAGRVSPQGDAATAGEVPLDLLPDDVQQMAGRLKAGQVERMFNRMMRGIGRSAKAQRAGAKGLLAEVRPDWRSPGGTMLRALMACLNLPDDWDQPDFVTLRDAYAMHRRLERTPNATRYPGDQEALDAVPDALDYLPIYGGQQA